MNDHNRSIKTIFGVIIVLLIAGLAAYWLYPLKKGIGTKQKKLEQTQETLHELRKEQNQRQMENHALKTSPAAIEKVAREEFKMVRKNESVIYYSKDAEQKWQERRDAEKKLNEQ